MKDTSSTLFHDACYLCSFTNLSHGFVPGSYVGISDALSRQFVDSTILEDFPKKALEQMPAITYDKPALFTPQMVQKIIWTSLHQGDMIDCTIRKTVLTNPPIDPQDCLMQMLQASPPEEFLNLLLQGIITKTHTNWLTIDKKKFTQVDFNQLLSKCESGRVLSEISRIIQLDDLSSKTQHFTENTQLHHLSSSPTDQPLTENISSSSLEYSASSGASNFVRKHTLPESDSRNLTAPDSARTEFPGANREYRIANSYTATCLASESLRDTKNDRPTVSVDSTTIQKLPNNHHTLLATFTPGEQLRVVELLKLYTDYLPVNMQLAMDKNDFRKILKILSSSFSTYSKYMFLPFYLPKDSKVALKSGDNNMVTLLTSNFIDIPASSHIYLNLDLQLLCRSTFIQLIPTMKDGSLFIEKLSSTSVVAKHEFKSVFIYNVTHHNIRIPKCYSLFTIEGLTYFPSNSGKILELKM